MIRAVGDLRPSVHATAFVHDSAEVLGAVRIGAGASIWPFCVLRGDTDRIEIGRRSNIQDLTVIHCDEGEPVRIGRGVTVGHRVVLHGARIGDGCLIGMGSVVMEASIGRESLVAAGSLVLAGMKVPPRSLVRGAPAKVIRPLRAGEVSRLRRGAAAYVRLAALHRRSSRVLFA